jgi:hypothetical protein
MTEKSHVAMTICPICNDHMDVLLSTKIQNGKIKEIFEQRDYVDPTHVCKTCEEKYLSVGVLIIDPKTCTLAILKDEAFKEHFTIPIPDDKICFMHEADMKKVGLVKDACPVSRS